MNRKNNRSFIALLAVCLMLLSVGCGGSSNGGGGSGGRSPVCTANIEPAIRLSVVDAASGDAINSGVTVTVQDGDFTETLISPQALTSEPVPNANLFQAAPNVVVPIPFM